MHIPTFAAVAALTTLSDAASIHKRASSLEDVCTVFNVQAALPPNGTVLGVDFSSAVTASAVYNSSAGASAGIGGTTTTSTGNYPYCNVTITYVHPGRTNSVVLKLAFPQPSDFKNRFYVAGGEAYSLSTTATGGLEYGAVGAATSAGYDAFDVSFDDVVLLGNGTVNWDATHMFGYEALGEMAVIGKAMTNPFYGQSTTNKVYTYYEGCSDGGRQGMSQVQRWGVEYDGAVIGAPAFRYAQQQTNHLFSSSVEKTLNYFPPPCALDKIVNATITACDPLDGATDGIVARTDLCMLNFNLSSIIGESYYCAAESSTSMGLGYSPPAKRVKRQAGATGSTTSYQPEQNGTVTADDVAVAQAIYDGLHDSAGQRAYLSWQIASELSDAETQWDNSTNSWELDVTSIGGEYVGKFVELVNVTNLDSSANITYDMLVVWMEIAYNRYLDTLQTTVPDLTPFMENGGKLIHYHGESDPSVPAASSVHYWQSVRSIMYPNATSDESLEALQDWYQLYIIPGAAHCNTNTLQPGPYPENNMQTMIDWVENGVQPSGLNATATTGTYAGETVSLCQWPTRPLWSGNSTDFECVTDEASLETWTYEFPAFKVPIY